MAVRVNVPIRIRLRADDVAAPERVYAVAGAALARALAQAREEALAPRLGYCSAQPMPPRFSWHGSGAGAVSASPRSAFERGFAALLAAAWREATPDPRPAGAVPLSAPAAAPAEPGRLRGESYLLDSYQQPPPQVPAPVRPAAAEGFRFWFAVRFEGDMPPDGEATLLLFVQQFERVGPAEARRSIAEKGWGWSAPFKPISAEEMKRGYRLVQVHDKTRRTLGEEEHVAAAGLARGERASIEAEAYARFWRLTRYREGEPLGGSADDRRMRAVLETLEHELLLQRAELDALPEDIRATLFGSDASRALRPADYARLLRIGRSLAGLTRAERAAYGERARGATDDIDAFDASVARYLALVEEQRAAAVAREVARSALFGLDALYDEYRRWKALSAGGAAAPSSGPMAIGHGLGAAYAVHGEMLRTLNAKLHANGIDGVETLEAAIRAFEKAFRDETVLLARDLLDRYEHTLLAQESRYRSDGEVRALSAGLAPARPRFAEATRIRKEEAVTPWTPDELAAASDSQSRFRREQAAGAAVVARLADAHPLLARQGFPVEELATTPDDVGAVRGVLMRFIAARLEDVRKTRRNLADEPDLVWRLPPLLKAAKEAQRIAPGSVPDKIIRHHVDARESAEAAVNLAIAVLAIALGIVSAGGGTVAVLAATASFGIGAAQAWDEFRRYEVGTAAYGAGLASDDPSLAWVVLAIAGAGVDVAGIAAALRPVRNAVSAFNASRGAAADVAMLERELRQLNARNEITGRMMESILRAARAEAEANLAWEAARASFSGARAYLDPLVTPALHMAAHFAYPLWRSLRREIVGIEQFLRMREVVALVGDASRLPPAALARVRQAYGAALQQVQRVATRAAALGMLDDEIERLLLVWNRTPDLSADDLVRQIEQWAEPLPSRRARTAPDLVLDPASRALLPDFERQVAGTFGIERISASVPRMGGRFEVTIEGEVLPGLLAREAGDVTPLRRRAPDFNRSRKLFTTAEAGLAAGEWQRLHLWGPGFGDEAAAGMMWGPARINLDWQNQSIEQYIRDLAREARKDGARVRLKATATSWEDPLPSGLHAPQGEHFLKHAEYEVTILRPGEPSMTIRIELELAPPPSTKVLRFAVDPKGAVNIADALRLRPPAPGTVTP